MRNEGLNENTREFLLTKNYRQYAVELAQESNTEIAWLSSQHFLERLPVSNDDTPISSKIITYGCQECGAELHPGWAGTSLRVCRSKNRNKTALRTLRRRLQRQKKKDSFERKKQAKDSNLRSGKSNSPQEDSESQPKQFCLLQGDPHVVVDRHHLALQCGRCQTRILLKGLNRESPPTKAHIRENQNNRGAKVLTRKESKTLNSVSRTGTESVDDFLQLPPHSSLQGKTSAARPASSILQRSKKKQKKKNTSGKQLLNFLSSLND